MNDTETLDRLEEAYTADHELRCQSRHNEGVACSVAVRWLCTNGPHCRLDSKLWCDAKYAHWSVDKYLPGICPCGVIWTVDHWRVVPL